MADERLKEIIKIAHKLGWMEDNPKGYPLMQLLEVEKCMVAMENDIDLNRMRNWYEKQVKKDDASKQESEVKA